MKKYNMFLILITCFLCFASYPEDIDSIVNRIRYNSYKIIEDYNVTIALRKYEIYDFITQIFPRELWEQKKELLTLSDNISTLKYRLSDSLKPYFPKLTDRNKIIDRLELTEFDFTQKSLIETDIEEAVHILRKPDNKGNYKYAEYSLSGNTQEVNETVKVNNEMNNWQIYTHKFENHIYKINFYSKKKIDMFTGNRDSYVHKISVKYYEDGKSKNIEKKIERWLNRGQSFEYILDFAVSAPEINIYFGTKKEHTRKAFIGFEFYISEISDKQENPDYELLETLNNIKYTLQLPEAEALSELRNIVADINTSKNTESQNISNYDLESRTQKTEVSQDKLMYFMYMLGDENITRKELQEKYREMFAL
jgi:hypothetical protein